MSGIVKPEDPKSGIVNPEEFSGKPGIPVLPEELPAPPDESGILGALQSILILLLMLLLFPENFVG